MEQQIRHGRQRRGKVGKHKDGGSTRKNRGKRGGGGGLRGIKESEGLTEQRTLSYADRKNTRKGAPETDDEIRKRSSIAPKEHKRILYAILARI